MDIHSLHQNCSHLLVILNLIVPFLPLPAQATEEGRFKGKDVGTLEQQPKLHTGRVSLVILG